MKTVILTGDDLSYAAEVIASGGLVAVPTETVYGLAASGFDADAVRKIYEVKNRPEQKPISLLVPDFDAISAVCRDIPDDAARLAAAFWPGPLTMVLPRGGKVPDIVTSGGTTVGVRCPDHPLTLRLLRLCNQPLAAPSANLSGMDSPKSVDTVLRYFDGKIECVIDGGECSVGVESTIIDLTAKPYRILRQGGMPRGALEALLGDKYC